ncbi:hypothetical protein EGH24_06135 [Halonotius terrestris]|uniref:Uncharacterized protein n=1 Tax=Halonotius terrestris TaxID=2487750 RepID=A0A8J8PD48_9EURY|nr:hypothetical protein [Halonotius terrestris]TQQ83007.1 hypothetical protein EGH24_06135 [Halonotius terrestris]
MLLLGLLFGLSVWHGTLTTNAADGRYPGTEAIADDPTSILNEEVTVWGTVVDTDPVVIEVEPEGERFELTLTGDAVADVGIGDAVGAHGVLNSPDTIAVTNAVIQSAWELQYLYLVSFLAGLWVLGRFLRGWRLDYSTLTVRPRE